MLLTLAGRERRPGPLRRARSLEHLTQYVSFNTKSSGLLRCSPGTISRDVHGHSSFAAEDTRFSSSHLGDCEAITLLECSSML